MGNACCTDQSKSAVGVVIEPATDNGNQRPPESSAEVVDVEDPTCASVQPTSQMDSSNANVIQVVGKPQDDLDKVVPVDANGDGNDPPMMQRKSSRLTDMLASHPATEKFYDIFASVPRTPGGVPERTPVQTLDVPTGSDFYLRLLSMILCGIVIGYFITIFFTFIFKLVDMMVGSCGEDTWGISATEACEKNLLTAFTFSQDTRCWSEPAHFRQKNETSGITKEDYDDVCGGQFTQSFGILVPICMIAYHIYNAIQKEARKVHVHDNFFIVQSISGKEFIGSYYADVTDARVGSFGLTIKTKAAFKLNAGGADEESDKKKQGKTMVLDGDTSITFLAGSGKARDTLLNPLAERLPVPVQGCSGLVSSAGATTPVSLLSDRVQEILDMRRADAGSYKKVRKPFTCDSVAEVIMVAIALLILWYVISRVFVVAGWGMNKGEGKCKDPMRPGEDMCAVWRIFTPLDVPFTMASHWISFFQFLLSLLLGPILYVVFVMPFNYKFHKNGPVEEGFMASFDWVKNNMVFPDDVEKIEKLHTGMDGPHFTLQVRAKYIVSGGLQSKFYIKAIFVPGEVKLRMVEPNCAACSCQGQKSKDFNAAFIDGIREYKPGCIADDA